jgi:hypothetical protein
VVGQMRHQIGEHHQTGVQSKKVDRHGTLVCCAAVPRSSDSPAIDHRCAGLILVESAIFDPRE